MRLPTAIAIAALASLTLGSAYAQDKPADKAVDKPASKSQCFWSRNVTSFAAPDDHTVYIQVNYRDVYRLDLMVSCPDVDWDQRVALVSNHGSGGSICGPLDAEIVSHATGIGHQRCPVKAMSKLTPEEIAALPKRAKP
jgi:Family of unknown function (DUF6491)